MTKEYRSSNPANRALADWSIGMGYAQFPLTPSLSPRERENGPPPLDHTRAGAAQLPSAKHQADACCSLSLRERVRVRGKYSLAYSKCSISEGLLSVASFLS